jgi:hypothetical protein
MGRAWAGFEKGCGDDGQWKGMGMMKVIFALFFLGLSGSIAQAIDMQDLAPCRPAAARFASALGE